MSRYREPHTQLVIGEVIFILKLIIFFIAINMLIILTINITIIIRIIIVFKKVVSFYLARVLGMTNVPPVVLSQVDNDLIIMNGR